MRSEARAIPRIGGLPLLGNLLAFRRDAIGLLTRVAARCGEVGMFHLGPRPVVLISGIEPARAVLVDQADAFEKGPVIRRYARPLFGDGLIACATGVHRARREQVAAAIDPHQVSRHLPIFVGEAGRALAALRPGETVDLGAEMRRLTLAVVGKALFSIDLLEEARELAEAVETVNRFVTDPLAKLWRTPWWAPTPAAGRARAALRRLNATIGKLIATRRRDPTPPPDFLSSLVALRDGDGQPLSDERVRDEAMTLFLAGHETTATLLTWAAALLALHPALAARFHDEVDRVLGQADPGPEQLARLSFTECILKEALRLYPPVHSLGRQAARRIRLGDHELPAGAVVIVSAYLLHRRADLHPDPERFDPDRFSPERERSLPERERRLQRHAYLPFGAGPRACLGAAFALTEAKALLALLARRVSFQLEPGARVEPEMLVTLRPRGPVWARVVDRTRPHG